MTTMTTPGDLKAEWDGKSWPPPATVKPMAALKVLYDDIVKLQSTVSTLQYELLALKTAYNNHSHMQFQQYQTPPPTGVTNQPC